MHESSLEEEKGQRVFGIMSSPWKSNTVQALEAARHRSRLLFVKRYRFIIPMLLVIGC